MSLFEGCALSVLMFAFLLIDFQVTERGVCNRVLIYCNIVSAAEVWSFRGWHELSLRALSSGSSGCKPGTEVFSSQANDSG